MSGSSTATSVVSDAPFEKRPLEVQVRIDAASAPHVLSRRHRTLHVDAPTDDDVIVTITCNPSTWLLIGGTWWLVESMQDVAAEEEAKRRGAEHASPSATSS